MTVPTIMASLLPIMWSTRTGAEVMKPLATPVIGGMVSCLIDISIVTPVIFAWLRERELNKQSEPAIGVASDSGRRKRRYRGGMLISNLKKSPGSHCRFTSTRSCGSLSL